MAKPTLDYEWATNTVAEEKVDPDAGTSTPILNKENPEVYIKQYGIPVDGKFARGHLNYQMNALRDHMDYQYVGEVGDVVFTRDSGITVTDIQDRYRSPTVATTWVSLGSDTLFGTTLYAFERTA